MPRQSRIEYAGAIYHVMNRGDRREPIFHDDFDHSRCVILRGAVGRSISSRPNNVRADCAVERLLGELHIPKDGVAGREELENYLEVRRAQEDDGELKHIRRGWCLGGEGFRQELL